MYIQPNKLMSPVSRIIRPYQCSWICTNGPNIDGKLNLSGIEIPYESQFSTRIVLNPGAENQPLYYGFLGEQVTFLLLKFTYDETNPLCKIEEEQYIEYYFKDNISDIKYASKILLLTGNSTHRIPQLFLNNPSPTKVIVEALVANMEQSDISYEDLSNEIVTIKNLYSNNIVSDTIWNCTDLISGSTQIQVINIDDYIELYLDYNEIDTIERNESKYELIISTKSDTTISLQFLSLFEMYQGHSRIAWVSEEPLKRYLTTEYPNSDLIPPEITLNVGVDPINSNVYVFPFSRNIENSGFTIYPDDILNYFIYKIEDNRDGLISVSDAIITIRKINHLDTLTGITETGIYDIIISISDIANNQSISNYIIIVDDQAPVITFKPGIGDIFTMNIPNDLKDPSQGITTDDIITKTVDSVYDSVDGIIPNNNINIIIDSFSGNTNIFIPGQYELTYSISDESNNISEYHKSMIVEGLIIMNSGDTFTFGDFMDSASFQYNGLTGTTANVEISGETFLIGATGVMVPYFIWDISGSTEHTFTSAEESINITVNNKVFTIIFNGWGSLLFTIEKVGDAPNFSNLTFYQSYKEQTSSGYTNSDIVNIDGNYLLFLDNNSESIYNIIVNTLYYNKESFTNTPVYLDSFISQTTGTTGMTELYNYYHNRYPNYNTIELNNILNGDSPFAELFKNNNDKFIINDLISDDNLYSIVMGGNYPKGEYNYKLNITDDEGYINTITFKFTIN